MGPGGGRVWAILQITGGDDRLEDYRLGPPISASHAYSLVLELGAHKLGDHRLGPLGAAHVLTCPRRNIEEPFSIKLVREQLPSTAADCFAMLRNVAERPR